MGRAAGTVLLAAFFSFLLLVWTKASRRYIPLVTLAVTGVLLASGQSVVQELRAVSVPGVTGHWLGVDQVRRYDFQIVEDSRGDITGTVDYVQSAGIAEHLTVTGSRMGADVVIRVPQRTTSTWLLTGRLADQQTITGTWSVGSMPLGTVRLARR
ncbi:MAG: hypothetical protein ACREPM_11580 [Gemmatimonadaceae bacterium]